MIAAAGVADTLDNPAALAALGDEWRRWRRQDGGTLAEAFGVGVLFPSVIHALKSERGIDVQDARVTLARRELAHLSRPDKALRGQALAEADLDRFPEIVAKPRAVLFDTEDPALLYVFDPADAAELRRGKVVVRVDYSDRLRLRSEQRKTMVSNAVRTAGYVNLDNLRESRYLVLEGKIE